MHFFHPFKLGCDRSQQLQLGQTLSTNISCLFNKFDRMLILTTINVRYVNSNNADHHFYGNYSIITAAYVNFTNYITVVTVKIHMVSKI